MATIDDSQVQIAPVQVIDYERLSSKDLVEVQKLLHVCQTSGIFYLNLHGSSVQAIMSDLQDMYSAAAEFFHLPHEMKMKYYRDGVERGFKIHDDNETFEISRDEDVQASHVLPTVLSPYATKLSHFSSTCDIIARQIVSHLAKSLDLEIPELGGQGDPAMPSDTGFKLCYTAGTQNPTEVPSKEHTDSGLMTILFHDLPTLQVPAPGKNGWLLVEPKDGCVVVNVANSLQAISGNKLHSPVHRVVQPAGPQEERYTAVWFLRPYEK